MGLSLQQLSGANHTPPPSLSCPEARKLEFPSLTSQRRLPWEGERGQLSLGTGSAQGTQAGNLERSAAGAGTQTYVDSPVEGQGGFGRGTNSVLYGTRPPPPVSFGDPLLPHPQPSHSV